MRGHALLAPLAAVGIVLAACSTTTPQEQTSPPTTSSSPQSPRSSTPSSKSTDNPEGPATSDESAALDVPDDFDDKTIGEAKNELDELGFTNITTAGGDLTDEDLVDDVVKAGETVAPDTEIVIVGRSADSKQQPQEQPQPDADTGPGCGQRAVDKGEFNPQCDEYQGYLDPGTIAGRDPTSGEIQHQYGCQQGYIPDSECPG